MRNFWQWLEAVEQQRDRLAGLLANMLPNLKPADIQRLIGIMQELEAQLQSPDDIRKSATISKFLKTFKPNGQESAAHTVDRFQRELEIAISRANSKGKTPEQLAAQQREELQKLLPDAPREVIESLLQQVKKGARPQDVANAYMAQKNAVGSEDKVLYREGNLELIEIGTWREGEMDKHLDTEEPAACHPLFKGTKWCVRFQDYFQRYVGLVGGHSYNPLYLIRENGKPLMLGHRRSEWLDVNDEVPSYSEMQRVAPFMMNSGSLPGFMITKILMYLPNPVGDTEKYIEKYGLDVYGSRLFRINLLGTNYLGVEGENVIIHKFPWLKEAIDMLEGVGKNKIDVNISKIEDYIDENANRETPKMSDLVDYLNSENEDRLIALLDKRFENGDYGEKVTPEIWEDMELYEALKHDPDLENIVDDAATDAVRENSLQVVLDRVKNSFKYGDDNGFKVDPKTWIFYIPVKNVNAYLRKVAKSKTEGEHEEHEINLEESLYDQMNFEMTEDEIELEFSSKMFNEKLAYLLPLEENK